MKKITHTLWIMLLLGLFHFQVNAQIELIADLALGTETQVIEFENEWDENLFTLGDQLLFILKDHPIYGTELWRMDTDEQVTLVKDLLPGLGDGLENTTIMLFNDLAYFLGTDSEGVYSLYQTDGTSEGTVLVKELYDSEIENLSSHHVVNGKLLFHISISEGQRDLWVTDGTAGGTEVLTANINVGEAINIGNQALVSGYDETHGNELWITDGTNEGTQLFKELNPGSGNGDPRGFYQSSIGIFFQGNTVEEGRELWMTDGTVEGTVLVKDVRDDSPGNGSNPDDFTELDGIIFFTADNALWKTDGTELGTELVVSGDPNNPEYLFAYDGELYFNAQGGSNVFFELYKTDGSTFTLVKDINTPSNSSSPKAHFIINDTHYFFAYDNTATGLWTTDGTEEGTTLIKHLYDGTLFPANIKSESPPTLFNERYYFNISNQLWRTNGTEEGTIEINHRVDVPMDSSPLNFIETPLGTFFAAFVDGNPHLFITDGADLKDLSEAGFILDGEPEEIDSDFIFYDNKLIFGGYTETEGEEPWITDGTVAGTHMIKDVNTIDLLSGPGEFFEFDGKVYFRAKNAGSNDFELFVTDGTEGGTNLVKDINVGISSSTPNNFGIIGDKMYFEAFTTTFGNELWETDGTEEGTKQVVDLRAGNPGAIQNIQTYFNDKVFFTAYVDAGTGSELYVSDGTEAGTKLLYEIGSGANSGQIKEGTFVNVGSKLVFTANNGSIWSTEGTTETTLQILTEEYTETLAYRYSVGIIGGKYVFVAEDNEDDTYYIFATDGTIENTVALASGFDHDNENIFELSNNEYLASAQLGGKLYFSTGFGIHATDGTSVGTSYFDEDKNGDSFTSIYPVELNGSLYFSGIESSSAVETLYKSDGTTAGTQKIDNSGVAVQGALQAIDNYIYFAGYDFEFGEELYRFKTTLELQEITFSSIDDQFLADETLTLSATASSSLETSFEIIDGPATVSGSVVTFTGLGTVSIKAIQNGNETFHPATPVEQSFEVLQTAQDITFGDIDDQLFGDETLTLGATSSSGLDVDYAIVSGPATVLGNVVTFTGLGEVMVAATQSGNDAYMAADPIEKSFTIFKNEQTITFNSIDNQFLEAETLTLSATASSGLNVSFNLISGPATLSGNVLTFTDMGTIVVNASQSGNGAFLSADPIVQSFEVVTVTGFEDEASALLIYPNPATNRIAIETQAEDISIQLLNSTGLEVMEMRPNSDNDISQLVNGIYFLRISNSQGTTIHKIIKQ